MNVKTPLSSVLLASLLGIGLSACGGSSSSGSTTSDGDQSSTPTASQVSGKAADGYLRGATVCLDTDADKACDDDEASATTGAGGAFTLEVPAGVDASAHAVVVEVDAGTIDEDTGAAVAKPYVLSAPPGKPGFISPLTTAVHGVLARNPALTADEAAVQVMQQVGAGSDVSLFEDYVAAQGEGANADEYARLHKVAQVSAKVLAENQEAFMEAAAAQGLDPQGSYSHLLTLVVEQALDQLEESAQAVEDAGDSFDVDSVQVTTADTTDLQSQIEEAEAETSFVKMDMKALLAEGGYWLWAESSETENWYEYGSVAAGSTQDSLAEDVYYVENGVWKLDAGGVSGDSAFYLEASGWQEATDGTEDIVVSYSTDGSARFTISDVNDAIKITASKLDVGGKAIKPWLQSPDHQAFSSLIDGDPTFSSGAEVYRIVSLMETDTYSMDNWYDCDAQHTDPGGNCNIIYGYVSGHAQSFADLVYPDGVESGGYFGVGDDLHVRVMQGGNLRIEDWQAGGEVSYGTWAYETVHGEQLMMLTVPRKFYARLWDPGQPFLAVRGGYVRRGNFTAKGTPENGVNGELWFNSTALQSIKDRLSL